MIINEKSAFSPKTPIPQISTPDKVRRNIMDRNISNNIPFASTYDKTKSDRKNKNCFMCRIKPIILVSELVDIDDPNMLDKIDNKDSNFKTCICGESPSKLSCSYCLSNKKEPKSIDNSNNAKNIFSKYFLIRYGFYS